MQSFNNERIELAINSVIEKINKLHKEDRFYTLVNIVCFVNKNTSGYTLALDSKDNIYVVDNSYVNNDGDINFTDGAKGSEFILIDSELPLKYALQSCIELKFGFQGDYNTDEVLNCLEGFIHKDEY